MAPRPWLGLGVYRLRGAGYVPGTVIYVLFALLAGLAWAIWFIMQWPLWLPLVVTAVVGLVAGVFYLVRLIRERRAASALERAIAEQGKQQEMNARPERRGEIQALQKQIQDGITALKASKLGGKRRGSGALYSLPWYAIIGPPGAGKTTALKHSGLVFPYADTAVRGVGGTRNCDWWFTNEAILLDTAGRYATEHGDQQEWLAFLDMLRKYRTAKPLNGLLVAVSVPDIIDANDAQLEEMGKKLRARIDEVMTKLRMVLPVYFLITKCDLIAGFSEFFGDVRKSERAQAWGATIALKENKSDPGVVFSREFDLLVKEIHARSLKRLALERNRQAREAIYQFPLELSGIKRNLQDLIAQVFMVNAFQGTPILRGVYFTSGTQEGTPLSRVLQRMGQAMGIRSAQAAQQQRVESKSYFLHDVFTKVVFPDAAIAARSASEVRRQKLVRLAVSAAALAVAVLFAIPSTVSFFGNRALLETAQQRAKATSQIDWNSTEPIRGRLEELDPLLDQLVELEGYERDGVPFNKRFLMYVGDQIYRPLLLVYVANMQKAFVTPTKFYLERQLKGLKGDAYVEERQALRTYLMLSDVEHLDVDWATGQYTALWAELNRSTSDVDILELKKRMRRHVRHYFELIKPEGGTKARAKPVPANQKVIDRAREVLQSVPPNRRYFALFVDSVERELYDPAGDHFGPNLQYPPVLLEEMFGDRPEVLTWLKSKQRERTKQKPYMVGGAYTDKGHFAVLANIKEAGELLEREQWVVPLTAEERGDRVMANVARLADEYEQRYIAVWQGFMEDLEIKSPANLREAIALYEAMEKTEWPLRRVLRRLEDHTQWKKDFAQLSGPVSKIANRKLNRALTARTGLRFNVDVNTIANRASKVPNAFKSTVSFGVPQDSAKTPLNETALVTYMEMLAKLRGKMSEAVSLNPDANVNLVVLDLQNAVKEVQAQLKPFDPKAQQELLPLLTQPLNVAGKIRMPTSVSP